MRYAILRLEEELRVVIDARRAVFDDRRLDAPERANLLQATAQQTTDLMRALELLRPHDRHDGTTLSDEVLAYAHDAAANLSFRA